MFTKEEEKIIQHRIDTMRPIKLAITDELVAELCKRDNVKETYTPAGTRVIYVKSTHGGLVVVEE